MFERVKRLYNDGKGSLTLEGVERAVKFGWITAGQYKMITGEDYKNEVI